MDPNNEKNGNIDDNILNNIEKNNVHSSEKSLKAKQTKSKFIKRIVILGIIFTIAFVAIQYFLKPMLPKDYLMLLQSIQVSIVGYFVIEIISNAFQDLTYDYLKDTSKSIKILMRILGAIVIIAIIISYLSNEMRLLHLVTQE